jgi:hypothetical protein
MSTRQIDLKEVPGIEVRQERLASIDPGLSVSAAGYDFDRTLYVLGLSGQGREGRIRTRSKRTFSSAGNGQCGVVLASSCLQLYRASRNVPKTLK